MLRRVFIKLSETANTSMFLTYELAWTLLPLHKQNLSLSILTKTRLSKAVNHFKTLRGLYQYCCGNSSSIWCSDSDSDFSLSSEESSGTSSPDLNQGVSGIASNDEDSPVLDTLYTIYFDFLLITLMKSVAQKVKENRENIAFLLDSSVRIRTFLSQDGELSSFIDSPGGTYWMLIL